MRSQATASRSRTRTSLTGGRLVFIPLVAVCLVAGIGGGLLRAGVSIPQAVTGPWLAPAVQFHAFLMISAFMGTLIGIERAVAVKKRWAYLAPLASGLAGLAALIGQPLAAAALAVLAASVFVGVNVLVVVRQPVSHTVLLLLGALAWWFGNLGFAGAGTPQATVPWWFAFLVLTIAAERLEMTRLMRRRPGARLSLFVVLAALVAGCALFHLSAVWGGVLYGAALVSLALWLCCFDIARRTIYAAGLSRYMAICLLLGYFWLAIAGVAWCATALGAPLVDAALHALGLGFVFSMMLAHAPVILPAVARVKVHYSWAFYLPLALLHGSLAVRLLLPHTGLHTALPTGATGNALAILLFIGTIAGSAFAWRTLHPAKTPATRHPA
jgi:hypothetical protein